MHFDINQGSFHGLTILKKMSMGGNAKFRWDPNNMIGVHPIRVSNQSKFLKVDVPGSIFT